MSTANLALHDLLRVYVIFPVVLNNWRLQYDASDRNVLRPWVTWPVQPPQDGCEVFP